MGLAHNPILSATHRVCFNATQLKVSRGSCGLLQRNRPGRRRDPVSGIGKLDQLGLRTAANHLVGHVSGSRVLRSRRSSRAGHVELSQSLHQGTNQLGMLGTELVGGDSPRKWSSTITGRLPNRSITAAASSSTQKGGGSSGPAVGGVVSGSGSVSGGGWE